MAKHPFQDMRSQRQLVHTLTPSAASGTSPSKRMQPDQQKVNVLCERFVVVGEGDDGQAVASHRSYVDVRAWVAL